MRLTPQDHAMTPDDVLFLLSHITSFADATAIHAKRQASCNAQTELISPCTHGIPEVSG
jgi:hypothetical protein